MRLFKRKTGEAICTIGGELLRGVIYSVHSCAHAVQLMQMFDVDKWEKFNEK